MAAMTIPPANNIPPIDTFDIMGTLPPVNVAKAPEEVEAGPVYDAFPVWLYEGMFIIVVGVG